MTAARSGAQAPKTARHAIVLDADALITLAQFPDNIRMAKAIAASLAPTGNELWLPQPIVDAFNDNKQRAIDAYWKAERTHLKNMRDRLKQYTPDEPNFDSIADAIKTAIDAKVATIPESVKTVDDLIAQATIVQPSHEQRQRAHVRFAKGTAPAEHVKRSSLNDCLIWEMVRDEAAVRSLTFVTNNCNDFGRHSLHNALKPDVEGATICYHDLEGFRKHHFKFRDIPRVVVEPTLLLPYQGATCPKCAKGAMIPQFVNGEWYVRCAAGCGYRAATGFYDD